MPKIDDKTLVPLGWVVGGMGVILAFAVRGAFWVSHVDDRLKDIEIRLGIPTEKAEASNLIYDANAEENKNEDFSPKTPLGRHFHAR